MTYAASGLQFFGHLSVPVNMGRITKKIEVSLAVVRSEIGNRNFNLKMNKFPFVLEKASSSFQMINVRGQRRRLTRCARSRGTRGLEIGALMEEGVQPRNPAAK